MVANRRLGEFLREVSNWYWNDFVNAEADPSYTTNESMIFAVIRSCAMQRLDAIKLSLNRLDGKLETPVQVVYPKVYYRYPLAEPTAQLELDSPTPTDVTSSTEVAVVEEVDLPSMGLRQTVQKMADYPRQLPASIVDSAHATERWINGKGPKPPEIPMVKSVVAAHLLTLAQNRDIGALTEVFDQIDGKLVETIKVLGEDLYIDSYATTAPKGAIVGEDGVMQIEATAVQDAWRRNLES